MKDHQSRQIRQRPLKGGSVEINADHLLHRQSASSTIPETLDAYLKIGFDRSVGAAALVSLAPLFLMLAALIYLRNPGPILFAHERLGRRGKLFRCLKFRTMATDADQRLVWHLAQNPEARREWEATRKLKEDPRITRLGRALRRSSLDELPQLINVLRGEMSLVGPRPIVEDEAHYYGQAIKDYFRVRPGLTGPWQISGRNDVGYQERVRLDQHYARTRSFLGDLEIIIKTLPAVLMQKGSY